MDKYSTSWNKRDTFFNNSILEIKKVREKEKISLKLIHIVLYD